MLLIWKKKYYFSFIIWKKGDFEKKNTSSVRAEIIDFSPNLSDNNECISLWWVPHLLVVESVMYIGGACWPVCANVLMFRLVFAKLSGSGGVTVAESLSLIWCQPTPKGSTLLSYLITSMPINDCWLILTELSRRYHCPDCPTLLISLYAELYFSGSRHCDESHYRFPWILHN